MIQYKKIFSIQFKHLYYGTDQAKFINDFEIVPTEDTKALLRNHGMVMKHTQDSIIVMGETVSGGTELKIEVSAKTKFRFLLKLRNHSFHNFTNIPLTGNEGVIYYFNNRTSHIPVSGDLQDDLLLLPATGSHASHYVDGTERIEILPEVFTKNLPVSAPNVKVEDVYDSSNVVFDSGATALSGDIQFNLRGKVQPGRYKLMQDGGQVGSDFYIDPASLKGGVFGVIEIFEVSGVNAVYQYVNGSGVIQNPLYVLAFENRSTVWKYFVNVKDTGITDPNDLRIDHTVAFPSPSVSGSQVVFTSEDPIPLKHETYKDILLYKEAGGSAGAYDEGVDVVVLAHMPNPSVEIVKPGSPDISEIFVYV